MVVNAAGPDAAAVLRLAGVEPPEVPLLHAANLVLRRPVVSGQAVGAESDGRFLFLAPWADRSLVGTDYRRDGPVDADAFFEMARRAFPWAGLDRADVAVVHRGRVPGTGRGRALDARARDRPRGRGRRAGTDHAGQREVHDRARGRGARGGPRLPAAAADGPSLAAPPGRRCTPPGRARAPSRTATRHAVEQESARHLTDAVLRRLDLGTGGAPSGPEVAAVLATMGALLGWGEDRQREERRALQAACAPPFAAPPG